MTNVKFEKFINTYSTEEQILILGYLGMKKLKRKVWLHSEERLNQMLSYMKENNFKYCKLDSRTSMILMRKIHSYHCYNTKKDPSYKTFYIPVYHPSCSRSLIDLIFYNSKILERSNHGE